MAARIGRFAGKAPVHVFLVIVGLFWLVPTFGLAMISLLPGTEANTGGWWQVFTEPGLATLQNYSNVLKNDTIVDSLWTTVFITMVINVLKVFDIILSLAPGSVQDDATVIAVSMWRTSFGGTNDFGLGSAIAVFLFLLVVPVIMLNIKRFRAEEG